MVAFDASVAPVASVHEVHIVVRLTPAQVEALERDERYDALSDRLNTAIRGAVDAHFAGGA